MPFSLHEWYLLYSAGATQRSSYAHCGRDALTSVLEHKPDNFAEPAVILPLFKGLSCHSSPCTVCPRQGRWVASCLQPSGNGLHFPPRGKAVSSHTWSSESVCTLCPLHGCPWVAQCNRCHCQSVVTAQSQAATHGSACQKKSHTPRRAPVQTLLVWRSRTPNVYNPLQI